MSNIVFGTDGWRGVIAKDFTFENIEKISYATAEFYIKRENISKGMVIGYDARFLSREFAETVAVILASRGIKVFLADSIISTPMVSMGILKLKAAAGLMITASHNPPIYNGFKIKASYGGPATREEISGVENYLDFVEKSYHRLKKKYELPLESLVKKKLIKYTDLKKIYKEDLSEKFDIDKISKSKIKVLYDPMYGAGQGFFKNYIDSFDEIHGIYNPSFNGTNPEPLAVNCIDTIEEIVKKKYDLGIVNDGDADRIGAIDEKGNFISTQQLFPIFLKYLVENAGMEGDVVKTVSVSNHVSQICDKNNVLCHETPVGFKYITEYMVSQNILIGGEESGGLGIKMHMPERDGIYNGLLLCKIMAERNKSLSELVDEIQKEYGALYYDRIDYHTTPEEKDRIIKVCKCNPAFIGGYKVKSYNRIDGFKFIFEDGWLLIRPSGTEPILRFYSECSKMDKVEKLLKSAIKLQ
jgi:alpha-D-glucose phosphate-specific phosphoglucomutase